MLALTHGRRSSRKSADRPISGKRYRKQGMGKRQQKAAATKDAIFKATAKVVGRMGFAKASMSAIAAEANVSYGRIYFYFESQQDLFNKLLPYIGEDMLKFISAKAKAGRNIAERERLAFLANLEYVTRYPEIQRILNEAAVFTPGAYKEYFNRMANGYARSLEKALDTGEQVLYQRSDAMTLALMFIGARNFLIQHFTNDGVIEMPPEEVKNIYLRTYANAIGINVIDILPSVTDSEKKKPSNRQSHKN
jgi:AcrR family transcriptional regulator